MTDIPEKSHRFFMEIASKTSRRKAFMDIRNVMLFHNYQFSCIDALRKLIKEELS